MSLKDLADSLSRKEVLLPILKKYLIQEKADRDLGKLSRRKIEIDASLMTILAHRARIKEFNHGEKFEGQYFHPSALGACLRQLWFGSKDAPLDERVTGENLLTQYFIFETGSAIHVLFQNLCDKAGVLIGREIAIVSGKNKTLGHADGSLQIGNRKYLLEIKSVNARNFAMTTEPKRAHLMQVMDYMKCLGFDCAVLVYVNKDRHNAKEFVVPFDQSFWRENVKDRKDSFFQHIETNTIPDREGDNPKTMPCSFCEFSRICYDTHELDDWLKKIKASKPHEIKSQKKSLYGKR